MNSKCVEQSCGKREIRKTGYVLFRRFTNLSLTYWTLAHLFTAPDPHGARNAHKFLIPTMHKMPIYNNNIDRILSAT